LNAVETVRVARSLSSILDCSFRFPVQKNRIFPIDHPEILLVSLFIVATKLCLPFQHRQSHLLVFNTTHTSKIDWKQWEKLLKESAEEPRNLPRLSDYEDIKVDRVVSMPDTDLEQYFSFISSLTDAKSEFLDICKHVHRLICLLIDNIPVAQLFPIPQPPHIPPSGPEMSGQQVDGRAASVLAATLQLSPGNRENLSAGENDNIYEAHRTVDDLSDHARTLYEFTGETYCKIELLKTF
jgi:RNA polymerase I-specific transcription initiation factor RRN7